MNKRLIGVMTALLAITILAFAVDLEPFDKELKARQRFFTVMTEIQNEYVDPEKTDPDALIDGAIKGMLMNLDPHSSYFTAEAYKRFQEDTKGKFGGLGIKINVEGGWLTVVAPMDDTPASRAGMRTGDKIVKIDGKTTRNKTVEDAVLKLRGEPGTKVTIEVYRRVSGKTEKETITLAREYITVNAISNDSIGSATNERKGALMVADDIGFVRLVEFTANSARQLEGAIDSLEKQGAHALVLDLRMNSGGLLDQAVRICDLFLDQNKVCVSVKPRENEVSYTAERPMVCTLPVAVLVNQGSASASEIVAGAIQDHHRGIIIGPKGFNTYGKGTVQTVRELSDGSGIKLTTAKYYTPSGRSITGLGIKPDIWVDVDLQHWVTLYLQNQIGVLPPKVKGIPGSGTLLEEYIEHSDENPEDDIKGTDVFDDSTEVASTTGEAKKVYDLELAEAVKILKAQLILQSVDPIKSARAGSDK
jgi:carboxyl-terminal processing protease